MDNIKNVIFKQQADLKSFCTFKIGGKARFLFVVFSTSQLLNVCKYCKENNIKFKVIGVGANLLFDDTGYNGAIIVNKSDNIKFENNSVFADSGVSISSLIMKCYLRSLCGMEALAGIPATIGGAIYNNLGAFNCSLSDLINHVECYNIDDLNTKIILKNTDCKFGYRNSVFKNNNYIITGAKLNLKLDEMSLINKRILHYIEKKKSSQPLNYPSAGSIFKRGNIIPAKIIDELGLKGTQIGNAEISSKHAGFIVNLGNAKSSDVLALIELIKNRVFNATGESLETEIEFVK